MTRGILDKTGDYIAQSAGTAVRAGSAAIDAAEDGLEMARSAARQGRDAAEDVLRGAARQIERRPVQTVLATGALAFGVGVLVGLLIKRR